jgi:hypothetical protein
MQCLIKRVKVVTTSRWCGKQGKKKDGCLRTAGTASGVGLILEEKTTVSCCMGRNDEINGEGRSGEAWQVVENKAEGCPRSKTGRAINIIASVESW